MNAALCLSAAKSVLAAMSCVVAMQAPAPATMPAGVYAAELSRCEWDGWHMPPQYRAADPLAMTLACVETWNRLWPARVSTQPAFDQAEAPRQLWAPSLSAPLLFRLPLKGGQQ